jgi:methyltransferase-like protein
MGKMSYESLPYPSVPLSQSHPERSATAATLLGMSPAAVENCRVLELGCASGGNLLPLSISLPNSRFLGIDLSERQIAEGQSTITQLGLKNVELRVANLLEIVERGLPLGEFDYIICHGVYSWVKEPVQRAILELCRRHLRPQGVAYISYNTYPGFYKRQPIRDLMLFHIDKSARRKQQDLSPFEAVREARGIVELMRLGGSERGSSWAANLAEETEILRGVPDGYVFHDHLEQDNRPCYFHEFVAAAQAQGLQFLTEAEPLSNLEDYPEEVRQRLAPFQDDLIVIEQYLDFLRNQPLRCTLLCHAEVKLDRQPGPELVRRLHASCAIWPSLDTPPTPADIRSTAKVRFVSPQHQVTVPDRAFKSVLMSLFSEEPQALDFVALHALSQKTADARIPDDVLVDILMYGYRGGLIRLHVSPPRFALTVSERPLASPLARLQARAQPRVTNLRHEPVDLQPLERLVLMLLDGKHLHAELLPPLIAAVDKGMLRIDGGPGREPSPADVRKLLGDQLKPTLHDLAARSLLIS